MVTIKQIAEELHVTRQTIYKAFDNAGLSINDLTTEKQGRTMLFDEAAAEKIKAIYNEYQAGLSIVTDERDSHIVNLQREIKELRDNAEELTKRIHAAEQRAAEAEQRADAAEKQNAQDQQTIDQLRQTVEGLNATIQAQAVTAAAQASTIQAMQQAAVKRIETAANKKPGFIARLFGRNEK